MVPKAEYNKLVKNYEDYAKSHVLKQYIKENFLEEVSDEQLRDGEIAGLFQALDDPYSGYLNKDALKDLAEHTDGKYGGVGVIVSPGDDNLITVVAPIEGTPGEEAGLKTGDKIIRINGEEFPADKMDKAVKVMKGEPNTKVEITILRKDKNGKNEIIEKEITRKKIKIDTVKSEKIDNLGYISISSFDKETGKDFKKELSRLEKENVDGIILDLRNNPGGLLTSCVEVADQFLDEGTVVYTQTRKGDRSYEKSSKGKTDLPLVVLVNGGSASASEIVSGAIQDRKRGTIIGETTFGKGIVQTIKELGDGTGFKLTESEYFTPSGGKIHGIGVKPDIEIELPEDVQYIGIKGLDKDTQLKKAIEILSKE